MIIIFRMARIIPFENFRIVSDLTWQQVPARAVVSECGKDRSVVVHWKQKGGASLCNNNIEGCGRQRGGRPVIVWSVPFSQWHPHVHVMQPFFDHFFYSCVLAARGAEFTEASPFALLTVIFFCVCYFFFFGSSCRKVIFMTFSRLALCCSFPFVWMRTRSPIRSAALKNGQVLVVVTCFTGGWWM